jgi:hypothetical protein
MSDKRRTITAETATMSLAMTNPEIRQSSNYGPAPEQGINARAKPARTDRLALIAAGVLTITELPTDLVRTIK